MRLVTYREAVRKQRFGINLRLAREYRRYTILHPTSNLMPHSSLTNPKKYLTTVWRIDR